MAKRSAAVAKEETESKIEKPKAEAAPKEQKEKKKRASTSTKFPMAHIITLLVDHNPKRVGSASHGRFENYEDEMTVEAALKAGVTAGDLAWDVAHGFVKIAEEYDENAEKKSKAPPKPKAEKKPNSEKPSKGNKVVDED